MEASGPFKNYAAASDIARMVVLYIFGGVYFDVDITIKQAKDIDILHRDKNKQPTECKKLSIQKYDGLGSFSRVPRYNSILTSPPKDQYIQKFFKHVGQSYKSIHAAQKKRKVSRIEQTMHFTGPYVFREIDNQLAKECENGLNKTIYECYNLHYVSKPNFPDNTQWRRPAAKITGSQDDNKFDNPPDYEQYLRHRSKLAKIDKDFGF